MPIDSTGKSKSKKTLEVRDFDETVTREEVVAALCIALGKPELRDQRRL